MFWRSRPCLYSPLPIAVSSCRTPSTGCPTPFFAATRADVLQSLVDIAGPTLGADRALIYDVQLLTRHRRRSLRVAAAGEPTSRADEHAIRCALFATAASEIARTGAPLESSRIAVHPLLAADGADALLHGQMSIQRLLWYPFGDATTAATCSCSIRSPQDRGWTPDELDFVHVVANQVSLALMKLELLRERERTEARASHERNRFRLFYDSTPSMFFTVDRAGAVRSVNQYASSISATPPTSCSDRACWRSFIRRTEIAVMHHLAACFDEPGVVREIAFRKICKDGSTMWVKETTRVAEGPDGATALIVCEDVTEARAHEEAAREAESKAHDKDEFMAMLGHELRNPLAPIVTALEILRRRGRDDEELELIDRQVAHLRRLVDDLLDVSRITRGKVELHMEQIDIAAVAAQAVEVARPLFQRKRQRLTRRRRAAGLTVVGDHSRLVQAFANLLTNAAKFSDDGQEIRSVGRAARRPRRDRGARSRRRASSRRCSTACSTSSCSAASPRTARRAVSGLGLTIVRNLVTLHGGTVRAKSEGRGKGTVVVVDLPARTTASPPSARSSADRARLGRRPTRAIHSRRRRQRGRAPESLPAAAGLRLPGRPAVGDGPSALAAAAELRPRVVLVDIGLPGMDGYELARQLRRAHPSDSNSSRSPATASRRIGSGRAMPASSRIS